MLVRKKGRAVKRHPCSIFLVCFILILSNYNIYCSKYRRITMIETSARIYLIWTERVALPAAETKRASFDHACYFTIDVCHPLNVHHLNLSQLNPFYLNSEKISSTSLFFIILSKKSPFSMRRVSNHIVASCLTFLSSSSSPLAELFVIFHPLFQRNPFYACRWYTQGPQGGVHTIGYCFGEKQCIRLNSYIFHLIKGFHQYLAKNANFCPKLAVFGPKILIFARVIKRFGTHITENHLGTLFVLFFGQAYGTKWNKNADIWPKMPILGKFGNGSEPNPGRIYGETVIF